MKIAFMFPGQGAQKVGMGRDIYEKYPEAKKMYDKSSKILNIDLRKLCFEGIRDVYDENYKLKQIPETIDTNNDLNKTENTQIAILVTSLAILEVLKLHKINQKISVGLSLGEYTALISAGMLDLEDGIRLVERRGFLMANNLPDEDYKMAAVIGMDSSKINEVCQDISKEVGFVSIANYNYSGQTVISGVANAIIEASEILKNKGAKKVVELKTSGPFHTSKLEKAKELYKQELEKAKFLKGNCRVIKNLDGTFYKEDENIREILANHIVNPVRFDKAIKLMKEEQIDEYVEIGPRKNLNRVCKKRG